MLEEKDKYRIFDKIKTKSIFCIANILPKEHLHTEFLRIKKTKFFKRYLEVKNHRNSKVTTLCSQFQVEQIKNQFDKDFVPKKRIELILILININNYFY